MLRYVPRLLKLAGPLVLSFSTVALMQVVDALVLSRHSSEAVAAMGPSSMAVIVFQALLFGTAGYAGIFVAHSYGRGDFHGVRSSAWLGIHTAAVSGMLALALAWPLAQIFGLVGHSPQVADDEMVYFSICMAGSFFPVLGAALSGWLAGIGRTLTITWVTFVSFALNVVLTWVLVLGAWGFPRMGMAGAALGTVISQMVAAILFVALFARNEGFADAEARRLQWREFRRFLLMALPMGLRISGEVVAWTVFLVIVGRLGTVELAASSIAFRINGLAFFPALGLGQAAGILIGHARGAGNDDEVPIITWQSLFVCEIWMLAMAVLFVTVPEPLMTIFAGTGPDSGQIVESGVLVLKFVAVYCLFDAANVMISYVLSATGDTGWIARAFALCTAVFMAVLWLVDQTMPSLTAEWILATGFVFATAALWMFRFQSGEWRRIKVLRAEEPRP
ncbi:MAG: MATE family efflux transporter [Deltaproteobacteria bacterium]|nr:MATE family efflux transporter [Deltaproteobacteria bacterium]